MLRVLRSIVLFVAAVLLLTACGDSETSTVTQTETVGASTSTSEETSTGETSTEETSTTVESTTGGSEGGAPPADVTVTELTGFTSPTGNIGCIIDRRSVRCDIRERDWDPPPAPADCRLDYGQGISLTAGGAAAFVCAGDTALDAGQPIPYGQSIAAGLLRCESAESGMTCRDVETGRGFSLAQQAYELF